jgi:undecaprenyl-diphosphatase UppP
MLRYFVQRGIFSILVLVGIVFVIYLGMDMTSNSDANVPDFDVFNYTGPAWQATQDFFGGIFEGDWGTFIADTGVEEVSGILRPAFVNSMGLLLISLAGAIVLGLILGGLAALRRQASLGTLTLTIIGISAPSFFVALLLQRAVIWHTQTFGRSLSVGGFGWAFVLGGIVMLVVERYAPPPVVLAADRTPVPRALAIGLCQMVALIPGVSRSGATLVGGRLAGLDRAAAAEFSFFLAMPTMVGAFVYELAAVQLSADRGLTIGIGFVMAFVAALVVVKPFLRYVTRVGFAPFAWYRIALGLVLLAAAARGWTFDAVAAP